MHLYACIPDIFWFVFVCEQMWSRLCIFVIVLSLSLAHVSALTCGTSGQYDCQNNATCVSNVCKCATSAWTGANCTTTTGCIVANTEVYSVSLGCVCLPAWNGTTCNTPSICNVTNTRDVRKGSCLCWRSWTGSDCNTCNWGTGCIAPQDINPMCYSCSTYPSSDIGPYYPDLAILVGPNDLVVSHPNTCSGGTTCNCVAGNPFLLAAAGTYCEKSYPCWAQGTGSTDGTSCNCRYNWQGDHCSWFGNGTDASTGGDLCIHTYLGFARGYCTFPPTSELSYSTSLCTGAPTPTYGLAPTYSNYTQTYPTSCTCESGAYGPFCQCGATLALGHPATNPCLNGGTCGNATQNACICTPGYQGYICNEPSNCIVANTLYTINNICVCDATHVGTYCQHERASQAECNVTTTATWDGNYCICKFPFVGPTCDWRSGATGNGCLNTVNGITGEMGYIQFPRYDGLFPYDQVCGFDAIRYYERWNVEPTVFACKMIGGQVRYGPTCAYPSTELCESGGTSAPGGGCTCPLVNSTGFICSVSTGCSLIGTSSLSGDGTCVCNDGYSGPHCDITSCGPVSSICYGNGACVNGSCNCTVSGYSGAFCNETLCGPTDNLCSGHGTCTQNGCVCDVIYTGKICDLYRCGDAIGSCSGRGNCTQAGCVCEVTGYGDTCQFDTFCDPLHTLRFDTTTLECICNGNWHGAYCSISPCELNDDGVLCSGVGVCTSNYTCYCPYSKGLHCEISVGCNMDGNGTLSYNWNTSTCICNNGYMAPYCCPYYDNPASGSCNYGGSRACLPNQAWNSLDNTCNSVTSFNQFAVEIVPRNGWQFQYAKCAYGFDPQESCCPFGMLEGTSIGRPGQCITPFYPYRYEYATCYTNAAPIYGNGGIPYRFCVNGTCTNSRTVASGPPYVFCDCDPNSSGFYCNNFQCNALGSNIELYDTFPFRKNGICSCKPGWSNTLCSCPPPFKPWGTDALNNTIQPMICANYSNCGPGVQGGVCQCADGQFGEFCCDREPIDTCTCPSGYGGTFCCKASCSDHGTCLLNYTTSIPYCECDNGYFGDYCQNSTISISCPDGCSGGGQCLDVDYTYDLATKLSYWGDMPTLWYNMSSLFFGGYTGMPFPPSFTPDPSGIYTGFSVTTVTDVLDWFVKSGRFQLERYKMELYGYNYTYNYILKIIRILVKDLSLASKLDYDFISTLVPYISDIDIDKQKAAVAYILTYGANINPASSQLPQMYPITTRSFLHCVCNPSRSGLNCAGACTTGVNSRPCTSLDWGDFHGVCASSTCQCDSRYIGAACGEFIGEGCFPDVYTTQKCNNKGTCTKYNNVPGNYSCVCRAGVTGTYCDTFKCSGTSIECSQVPNAVCQASGVCDCAVPSQLIKSNSLTNKPLLPVGQNCQYNAIDQCGNAVALVSGGYQWKECNGRGTCTNDTSHAQPYCVCQSGYSGPQCTNTACSPNCNNNQNCNSATGTCSCQSKWSTPSGCTSGNRTCECTLSLCGHGVPDSTGTSCICDTNYRLDSNGLCTIVQCPLIAMTDNGEVPCNVTLHGICASTSPSTAATQSHQTGCCYDACRSSQGISRCSLNASQPVCACNPTAAFNQVNGICYSKCNGQAASTDDTFGYRCGPCLTSFFIQDPWNSATDFMDANCKRSRCLNGGTVAATNANCNCPSGFTGILCQTATTGGGGVSSSSSSSTATSSSSTSSTYSSSAPSTAGSSTIVSSTVVPSMSSSSSSTSSSTSPSTHSSSTTTGLSLSSSSSSSSTANDNNTVTDTSSSPVLSTGGIVGVAIGSTIVAGAIGYSVYWTFWIKPIAAKYGAV